MVLVTTGPVASLQGTIPAATLVTLSEGSHIISIRSRDAVTPTANWGDWATATLVVDKTGPAASDLKVEPDPEQRPRPRQRLHTLGAPLCDPD